MSTYRIGDQLVEKNSPEFERMLASIHNTKDRPFCMCQPQGVEMYVIRLDGRYYIKRMPSTGGDHSPGSVSVSACSSYEPPAELSGLGQVIGSAIVESPDEGTTALKLQFSLTKASGRSAPVPSDSEADSVRTDGNKLSLRALLHFLWDEAGFHKWSPYMQGKRNWAVLRKYLLQAAQHKNAKGNQLADILYIPEPFSVDRKTEIVQRRMAQLAPLLDSTAKSGARKLMLLVAEVKEFGPSRNGYQMVAKHLSDFHFMLNEDIHKRLVKRFEMELSLWDSIENSHLVAIATFGVNRAGVASIEEIGLMVTTDNWVPFENLAEKTLLDALTQDGRRYIKGLRYNLSPKRPLASVVLTDTSKTTAMYIHPTGVGEEFGTVLAQLIEGSKMASWIWQLEAGAMPAIPRG